MDEGRAEEIVSDVAERLRAWLRGAADHYPHGFDIGTFGVALDLHFPDGSSAVGYACSDGREWVHAGLFRAAMKEAEASGGEPAPEDPTE